MNDYSRTGKNIDMIIQEQVRILAMIIEEKVRLLIIMNRLDYWHDYSGIG